VKRYANPFLIEERAQKKKQQRALRFGLSDASKADNKNEEESMGPKKENELVESANNKQEDDEDEESMEVGTVDAFRLLLLRLADNGLTL